MLKLLLFAGLGGFVGGLVVGFQVTSTYLRYNQIRQLEAQIEQNQKVIDWSRKEIAKLNDRETKVNTIVKEIQIEAYKDPTANRTCLSTDSILRLNKIR